MRKNIRGRGAFERTRRTLLTMGFSYTDLPYRLHLHRFENVCLNLIFLSISEFDSPGNVHVSYMAQNTLLGSR